MGTKQRGPGSKTRSGPTQMVSGLIGILPKRGKKGKKNHANRGKRGKGGFSWKNQRRGGGRLIPQEGEAERGEVPRLTISQPRQVLAAGQKGGGDSTTYKKRPERTPPQSSPKEPKKSAPRDCGGGKEVNKVQTTRSSEFAIHNKIPKKRPIISRQQHFPRAPALHQTRKKHYGKWRQKGAEKVTQTIKC